MNYIYVFVNSCWSDRADELFIQVRAESGSWAHVKSARELMLIKETLFHDYDRVIVDLPANDIGVACAEVLKNHVYKLSYTIHYAGIGYHDYFDLIKDVMVI